MSCPLRHAALVVLGAALAACADQPTAPTSPSAAPLAAVGNNAGGSNGGGHGKSSLELVTDDYDAGLLDRDNASRYLEYAISAPSKLPPKYRSAAKGKDATLAMLQIARDWDQLSASTKKEIKDLRGNGFGNLQDSVVTAHFVLHYTTKGDWAVPARDANGNGIPDFIDASAASWEEVWTREVVQLGYPAPKLTTDAFGNPTNRFHVYFKDMPYYGYCVPENVELTALSPVPLGTASAWIVVENDFAGFPPNDVDRTGTETVRVGALKVTQAHEFMHALQFNINVYQSGWLFESHATWAEDAVYDGINDWHWYINTFLRTPELPVFSRYVYGSAYFQNWLSERYGVDVTRQVWLAARTNTAADAVRLAAFGGSWAPIADFAPAQPTLAISDFTTDPTSSVLPNPTLLLRATHAEYPVAESVPPSTKKVSNGAPWGLGSNFVAFVPGTASGNLTLTFDGEDGAAWRAFALVQSGSTTTVQPIVLDGGGAGTIVVPGFGTSVSRVTLALTIADRGAVAVPYAYGATVGGATIASR